MQRSRDHLATVPLSAPLFLLLRAVVLVRGLLTRPARSTGFLLTAQFNIDKKLSNKSEIELQIIFMEQLAGAGVVDWVVIDRFNETNLWEETE